MFLTSQTAFCEKVISKEQLHNNTNASVGVQLFWVISKCHEETPQPSFVFATNWLLDELLTLHKMDTINLLIGWGYIGPNLKYLMLMTSILWGSKARMLSKNVVLGVKH